MNDEGKQELILKTTVNVLKLINSCFTYNKRSYVCDHNDFESCVMLQIDTHLPKNAESFSELKVYFVVIYV